jgi:glycerol-1-phosphate dehydrogenase [NAD(P)+]
MTKIDPIYVGLDAIGQLIQYCKNQQLDRFTLIADTNTYRALGERVETALNAQGYDVAAIVLTGDEVIADAHYLVDVLVRGPVDDRTFIAVGSGTLTDITRFTSHRSGRPFISMPTAPSVDGFTSIGAPLVLHGVKITINCQAPIALFADLETLCDAPQELVAAGFGDMIGKISSLADWKLGPLLWDEPFDEAIYQRTANDIQNCLNHAQAIGQRSQDGISRLMDSLIDSGICMLDFGSSPPASGAEHHASHYWEMLLLQEHRPAVLHGAKVGFALIHQAEQYAKIRAMSRQEMLDRLEAAVLPDRESEIATIKAGYGAMTDDIIRGHKAFLDLTPDGFEQVKQRIANNWDAIQQIAAGVLPPETIVNALRQVGGVTDGHVFGLSDDEIKRGFQYGHYLRNRFTVMKLSRMLGIDLD